MWPAVLQWSARLAQRWNELSQAGLDAVLEEGSILLVPPDDYGPLVQALRAPCSDIQLGPSIAVVDARALVRGNDLVEHT